MLQLEGVESGYGASRILFGMTFDVPEGSVRSLIGRNGMGKTTTIRTIMGALPLRSGRITIRDRSAGGLPPNRIARIGVGLVPEGRRIFPSLSVEENLVATAHKQNGERWTLKEVYALFPRLGERRAQSARTLSGGEQQMLAIGRALMTNPLLLILDEATEGIAPIIRAEIWACLKRLKADGMTILVIDKNLGEMVSLVDLHHAVEKGRIAWRGTPGELSADRELSHRILGI